MGGSFDAVVQIHTKTRDERTQVSAKVDVSSLNGSGGAEFAQKISAISKEHKVTIWSFQQGGRGTPSALEPSKINQRLEELPSLASNNGVPLKALITSYAAIISDPDIQAADFLESEGELAALADAYDDIALK